MIKLDDHITDCINFKWQEFLFLPQWEIHAFPASNQVWRNIKHTAIVMEKIRLVLGSTPLHVTSGWRPYNYNRLIGGAEQSQHVVGRACDFVPIAMSCIDARLRLEPYLEELGCRMEDKIDASWIHIDLKPSGKRYFRP